MFNTTKSNLILFFFISSFFIFVTSLISFNFIIQTNYSYKNLSKESSDYVVVATGGSNRLKKGLDLMRKNFNGRLLLTGIGKGITKENIENAIAAKQWQKDILNCCVDYDYFAEDTKGNALETKIWTKKLNINSIYLVSANYHMPRLLLEMKAENPNLKIIPITVEADSTPIKNFWKLKNFKLILNEYFKLLITYFRLSFELI